MMLCRFACVSRLLRFLPLFAVFLLILRFCDLGPVDSDRLICDLLEYIVAVFDLELVCDGLGRVTFNELLRAKPPEHPNYNHLT